MLNPSKHIQIQMLSPGLYRHLLFSNPNPPQKRGASFLRFRRSPVRGTNHWVCATGERLVPQPAAPSRSIGWDEDGCLRCSFVWRTVLATHTSETCHFRCRSLFAFFGGVLFAAESRCEEHATINYGSGMTFRLLGLFS